MSEFVAPPLSQGDARRVHVTTGAEWDYRRNTSATRPPPPGAHRDALKAVAALRESDPALVQWISDGHPTLTEAEHIARFGEPYERRKR